MAATVIAFGGKGGAGKTTLSSMVIRELVRVGKKPILAVDADPNATLALTLGERIDETIADIRDRMGEAAMEPTAIPKDRLMDQWLAEILTEGIGFDVLTMGRPEGPKCYCYVNGLLRRYLKELKGSYAAIVIDCEAGMEYLSRLAVDDVDVLVLVAEANPIALRTVSRIAELADSLPVRVGRRVLALNKVDESTPLDALLKGTKTPAVDGMVVVPQDEELRQRCMHGEPIDGEAGDTSRAAIAELTQLCLETN